MGLFDVSREAFESSVGVGAKELPAYYSPHCTQITVFTQLYPGQKIEKVCTFMLQPIIFTALQWLNNLKGNISKPTTGEVYRPWKH
jgi:hypothetical protein